MSTAIRPLAEVLTGLPAFESGDAYRAAAPFELYDEVSISPYQSARWTLLLERLNAGRAEARDVGQELPRVGVIGETLTFLRRRLAGVAT